MPRVPEIVFPETALTVSGGLTPSATFAMDLETASGPISLFLNGATSNDVTVTYRIGVRLDLSSSTITYVTPSSGGAVSGLTNVSFAGGTTTHHGSISIPSGLYFRFTVTNNAAALTATVKLIVHPYLVDV